MNILIVGPSWVGDMVMAQTLFMRLREQYPSCEIDVLAPEWSRPILERMPEVRAALSFPLGHGALDIKTRRKIGHSLKGKYDWAIVLPNSLKSALVPFFAKIPKRTGWKGEMRYILLNDIRALNKEVYPLMIERFMALAYPANKVLEHPYPQPYLVVDPSLQQEALHHFHLQQHKPVLGICPGAEFGEAKKWPTDHYFKVVEQKISEGWQVWAFGSKNDYPVGETIRNLLSEEQRGLFYNLAGQTTLAQAIDLLGCVDRVVTNDSGLMHVAAALKRPIVAVYGSTSPKFTPPLSDNVKIVRLGLSCSPCFQRTCKFGHYNCLKELKPSIVLDALDQLIDVKQVE